MLYIKSLSLSIYIYVYKYMFSILPCNNSTQSHYVMVIAGRTGGLSSLCHSCGFARQQRLLETFSGYGYFRCKDEVA